MIYAYVGCRSTEKRNARGKGLRTYEIDEQTGDWRELQTLKTLENPSYQCMDREGKYLYSVHGDFTQVTSYRILPDHTLEYRNTVDTVNGQNPVFLTADHSNRFLLVATLQGGRVYVIERRADGTLGDIVFEHFAPGIREGSHSFAHQCIWDQSGRFLFVVYQGRDQGIGQVKVLRFCEMDGSLTETDSFRARQYAEPRHLAVHPNNRWCYLINEKGNAMTFLEFDAEEGKLQPRQILPTLPETYTGEGQASASLLNERGDILIGSNRIHESVVLYRIDPETGYMRELGYYPTLGLTPRFMCFGLNPETLYVANEDSDTIVEMKLDRERGQLSYTGRIIHTESPVCITFQKG